MFKHINANLYIHIYPFKVNSNLLYTLFQRAKVVYHHPKGHKTHKIRLCCEVLTCSCEDEINMLVEGLEILVLANQRLLHGRRLRKNLQYISSLQANQSTKPPSNLVMQRYLLDTSLLI